MLVCNNFFLVDQKLASTLNFIEEKSNVLKTVSSKFASKTSRILYFIQYIRCHSFCLSFHIKYAKIEIDVYGSKKGFRFCHVQLGFGDVFTKRKHFLISSFGYSRWCDNGDGSWVTAHGWQRSRVSCVTNNHKFTFNIMADEIFIRLEFFLGEHQIGIRWYI